MNIVDSALAPRLPRRRALSSGAAAMLAAARSLGPALFTGCSVGIPDKAPVVEVGLLHSQTGPLAISETSLRDINLHAFERINAAGGILGRQVVARAPDPRSRPSLFAKRAARLVEQGVAAVFGCWTSASRKAVLPVLEAARTLLFYPVQYEGNESAKYCVYGGMVPNQQILPTIDWFLGEAGGRRRRIYLLGSDYVFPRTANLVARKYLQTKDLTPVGESYLPLGERDFGAVIQQIKFTEADCVLSTVNGDSNLGLFAALGAANIDPEKVPVVSTSVAEDELRSLLPDQVRGHYAAACYFQTLPTDANRRWVAEFQHEFGFDRVTGDPMAPGWCLVHLWKQAVELAGTFEADAVREAFRDGLAFDGPGGTMRLDPRTQHCDQFFRIGRIRADRQFEIVHDPGEPIVADPYPQIAFPGWSVDWTKDGITPGAEVDIHGDV